MYLSTLGVFNIIYIFLYMIQCFAGQEIIKTYRINRKAYGNYLSEINQCIYLIYRDKIGSFNTGKCHCSVFYTDLSAVEKSYASLHILKEIINRDATISGAIQELMNGNNDLIYG